MQPGKYLFYGFSNHMTFTDGKIVTNLSKGSKFALFSVAEKEIKAQKDAEAKQKDVQNNSF